MVSQLNEKYEIKDETVAAYVRWVFEVMKLLKHFSITDIPRSENRQADALSKLANSFEDGKSKRIQWETLKERSIDPHEIFWLGRSSTWVDSILAYLATACYPYTPRKLTA